MRPLDSPSDTGLVLVTSAKPSTFLESLPLLVEQEQPELHRTSGNQDKGMRKVRITVKVNEPSRGKANTVSLDDSSGRKTTEADGVVCSLFGWTVDKNEKPQNSLPADETKEDNFRDMIHEKAGGIFTILEQSRQDHFACRTVLERQDSQQEGRDDVDIVGKGDCSPVTTDLDQNALKFDHHDLVYRPSMRPMQAQNRIPAVTSREETVIFNLLTKNTEGSFEESPPTNDTEENRLIESMLEIIGTEKERFHKAMETIEVKHIFQYNTNLLGSLVSFYGSKSEVVVEESGDFERGMATHDLSLEDEEITKDKGQASEQNKQPASHEGSDVGSGMQESVSRALVTSLPIVETVTSLEERYPSRDLHRLEESLQSAKAELMVYSQHFSSEKQDDSPVAVLLMLASVLLL
jgi:hypothetical protein